MSKILFGPDGVIDIPDDEIRPNVVVVGRRTVEERVAFNEMVKEFLSRRRLCGLDGDAKIVFADTNADFGQSVEVLLDTDMIPEIDFASSIDHYGCLAIRDGKKIVAIPKASFKSAGREAILFIEALEKFASHAARVSEHPDGVMPRH